MDNGKSIELQFLEEERRLVAASERMAQALEAIQFHLALVGHFSQVMSHVADNFGNPNTIAEVLDRIANRYLGNR